ncbi:MAG: DUF188 domain-containing protein [Spirochaetales bacterium]|nr:DUF188 domain-containing protein [Candidatus Physcosoma equi]
MFNLYIDADSLPKTHRAIVLKRLLKENDKIGTCIFAADRELPDVKETMQNHTASLRSPYKETLPKEELRKIKTNIQMIVVATGANSADDKLVELAEVPGFAITHDIPLAARLVEKGIVVLDDRGNEMTKENVRERLSVRDFMTELRDYGFQSDKTKPFDNRTLNEFSNAFDRLMFRYISQYS